MSSGPYREEPRGPRYVCLVCYAYASAVGGLCTTCEVDLLSLDDSEVRAELRAEAERRMQKRQYGEYFALSLFGFMITIPLLPLMGELVYFGGSLGVGWIATQVYTRLRRGSALALYAERRRRLARELAGQRQQPVLTAGDERSVDEGDPEELSLEATLRWLGVRLDERGPPERKK